MSKQNATDELLTVAEAAAVLKYHPVQVRAMAAAGQLPGKKIGGQWRFSRQALLDLAKPTPATTTEAS